MWEESFSPVGYDPRWRRSKAMAEAGPEDDEWVIRYREFLKDVTGSDDYPARVAHEFFSDHQALQGYIEALITAGASHQFCAEYYSIPPEAVEFYEKVFYDISPLTGMGSRTNTVLKTSMAGSDAYKLKKVALKFGLNVLRWRMGEPIELTEEELDSLYRKVQQGLAMRLQELEVTSPTHQAYTPLLKTVETATKFRAALRDHDGSAETDKLVDLLKKNLSPEQEPCFDRDQVLASRATKPKEQDDE